jgi:hypothetical protein
MISYTWPRLARVEHMFFDYGGDSALAFMQWIDVPGILSDYGTGINRGLGVSRGTFHFSFRCPSQEALHERRLQLKRHFNSDMVFRPAAREISGSSVYRPLQWHRKHCNSLTKQSKLSRLSSLESRNPQMALPLQLA